MSAIKAQFRRIERHFDPAVEPYRNEAKLQELRGYVFDAAEELMRSPGPQL